MTLIALASISSDSRLTLPFYLEPFFRRFASYHTRPIHNQTAQPCSTAPGKGGSCKAGVPNLFQVSWLWADQETESNSIDSENNSENNKGRLIAALQGKSHRYAEEMTHKSVEAFDNMREQPIGNKSSQNPHCSYLKFSRSSTPSGMEMLDNANMEEGCYIALCRVLISKQHTTNELLSDELIAESVSMGFDTIYSKASDEYALLNPRYVLPEFIMQIQMIPSPGKPAYQHMDDRPFLHSPTAWLPASLQFTGSAGHNTHREGGTNRQPVGSVRPHRTSKRVGSADSAMRSKLTPFPNPTREYAAVPAMNHDPNQSLFSLLTSMLTLSSTIQVPVLNQLQEYS